MVDELRDYGATVDVHDPWADPDEARAEYGLDLVAEPQAAAYDGVILAVAHDTFRTAGADRFRRLCKPVHVLFDLKAALPAGESDLRL